jgi:hypothetical protein
MSIFRRNTEVAERPIVFPTLSDARDFIVVEPYVNPDGFPMPDTLVAARVYRHSYRIFRAWKTVVRHPSAKSFRIDSRFGRDAIQAVIDQTAADYEAVAAAWRLQAAVAAERSA